ncbi:Uncharacterised protein [Mycobacteroides abscessus subsp. abscessus]|nr:Uncharacterised protein [Mycobacteroides abscessus subsp. abscessus]
MCIAEKWRCPCRYSDMVNRNALHAMHAHIAVRVAEANGMLRKKRRSMKGCRRRDS